MEGNRKLLLSSLAIPFVWILSFKLTFMLPLSFSGEYKRFASGIVGTLLVLFITHQFSKLNKVSFREIGLNWEPETPKRILVGLLIGLTISIAMVSAIVCFTEVEIKRFQDANIPMACFMLLAFFPLAFMEEVAFRGFIFFKLEKIIGLRFTILITSILFAFYHDLSGATFTSQLLGPGIWGVVYGISAIWSKGLAVPTGIHAGANIVLAALGTKEDNFAIWMFDYPSEVTEMAQSHTEMVGLIIQLALLLFGIIMTEWYLRKK